MEEIDLKKLCKKLAYSKKSELSDDIFDETVSSLRLMWPKFGHAIVLGELSKIWSIEKAVPFFERVNLKTNNRNEIKTIATHYRRCCNGGVERVQAQLMNLWMRGGYKVILLTEEPECNLDYSYPMDVKRVIIPTTENMTDRLTSIQKVCMEERVDLYVNHSWQNDSVLWECMLLKLIHIPFVQYIHGHFAWSIWKNKDRLYEPEIFRLCDLVISLSETNARFYQLCGCQSYLIQNPVPEDLAVNTDVSRLDSKHVLLVGRLSDEKHPMDALMIFKKVHDYIPEAVLDIVGGDESDYVLQINDFIKENKLHSSVILHGKKNQAEVAEFYKNSSCVIFTSEMEGYPMVILESKAYGLPLMMYELPYLALVKDGRGVVAAKQGDINSMANNIIKLLKDDAYRISLGKEARESFETFNSYDLEGNWKNIIMLCSFDKDTVKTPSYFDPDEVSFADKFIEPMLLEGMKKGYDYILKNNIDYFVGRKILLFPRKIKAIFYSVKRILGYAK